MAKILNFIILVPNSDLNSIVFRKQHVEPRALTNLITDIDT